MSAVERVEYMDNMRAQQLTEAIVSERKQQRNYFAAQAASGGVVPMPPTPPTKRVSPAEEAGVPEHVGTIKRDPEHCMTTNISKHMWAGPAPGYIVRDGPRMAGTMKQDFTYDAEEVEYMKSLGYMDKKHNRRRDEFVKYVEAHAKMQHLIKGPTPGQGN